ncbi:MAG: response regulator [Flavobacteriaceae bacterium]|nr:response regulator [Flavobacteriaceae bacterium]
MTKPVEFVLLIDDDSATNFFNGMMLERHNCFDNVLAVKSGEEALSYLISAAEGSSLKPDLIFLDINMPGMNGWEFLDALSRLDSKVSEGIKIILLSTSAHPEEVRKSMSNYEVADYINKPLSMKLLDSVFEVHFKERMPSTP